MARPVQVPAGDLKPGDRFLFKGKQVIVTDKKPLCCEVYTGKLVVVPSTIWVTRA